LYILIYVYIIDCFCLLFIILLCVGSHIMVKVSFSALAQLDFLLTFDLSLNNFLCKMC